MRNDSLRRRLTLIAATSAVAALLASACGGGDGGAQMTAGTEGQGQGTGETVASTEPTVPPTITVLGATTIPMTTTSPGDTAPPTTKASSGSGGAPATTASPATTSTTLPTLVTLKPLVPINPIVFGPTVNSVSTSTSVSCFGGASPVSWTTSWASSVSISVDGTVVASGLPTNSSYNLNLAPYGCSRNHTVQVTARWSDGTAGGSKSVTVWVNWI